MTRIITGTARGRRLAVPADGTRPTSDRVREAVFSSLEARSDFAGLRVLDLFAGSGALGLEALSRGAREALLVEADGRAARVIRDNIRSTGLHAGRVRRAKVATVLAGAPDGGGYGLVFADPPYAIAPEEIFSMLDALAGGGWLAAGALMVLERSARAEVTQWPGAFDPPVVRRYGETRVETASC